MKGCPSPVILSEAESKDLFLYAAPGGVAGCDSLRQPVTGEPLPSAAGVIRR